MAMLRSNQGKVLKLKLLECYSEAVWVDLGGGRFSDERLHLLISFLHRRDLFLLYAKNETEKSVEKLEEHCAVAVYVESALLPTFCCRRSIDILW